MCLLISVGIQHEYRVAVVKEMKFRGNCTVCFWT